MLVGAFEIEVGRPLEVRPLLQHEGVRGAGIEPDVEDVAHLLVGGNVVDQAAEEPLGGAVGEPGVRALGPEGGGEALRIGLVVGKVRSGDDLAALAVAEHGDRHAPGALAADHPVGPVLDHGAQAVLSGARDEARLVDGREGARAQRVALAVDVACPCG